MIFVKSNLKHNMNFKIKINIENYKPFLKFNVYFSFSVQINYMVPYYFQRKQTFY